MKQRKSRELRQQEIYSSAIKVFSYYGYDGTTMDRIANEAGVSKALVIKMCGSKEEIANVCLQRFVDNFLTSIRRINEQKITWRQKSDSLFELFQVNRAEWRFVMQLLNTPALEHISRPTLDRLFDGGSEVVFNYNDEVAEGKHETVTYLMGSQFFTYVIGGNIQRFLHCREEIFETYKKK